MEDSFSSFFFEFLPLFKYEMKMLYTHGKKKKIKSQQTTTNKCDKHSKTLKEKAL